MFINGKRVKTKIVASKIAIFKAKGKKQKPFPFISILCVWMILAAYLGSIVIVCPVRLYPLWLKLQTCACWETNLGLLEKQLVILTTESCLQLNVQE